MGASEMRILVFGDSTAQGYYDLEMGGWVNLLFVDNMKRKARHTDNPVEIFNVSVSGDTTQRITTRLQAEAAVRKWQDEPIMLIFAVGVNDSMLEDGNPISSPEQYRAELEELYAVAKPLAQHIVFVGLESVNEAESNPWIFNSGTHTLSWQNERVQLFDNTLKAFAEEKGATYVPVFDLFRERQARGETLHEDGLHPNAAGHRLIFEQVSAAIRGRTT